MPQTIRGTRERRIVRRDRRARRPPSDP